MTEAMEVVTERVCARMNKFVRRKGRFDIGWSISAMKAWREACK